MTEAEWLAKVERERRAARNQAVAEVVEYIDELCADIESARSGLLLLHVPVPSDVINSALGLLEAARFRVGKMQVSDPDDDIPF